ncbi:hypothetical protein [Clostridium cibarium]|uniref:Uncharacterized protein n=1 Tax=Clostridium cibarium TaxID=2762247 RepID=A0ABR8PYA4_9CLOT|nr:hypothetical protein [Clostridium cibarium]MBD7913146.1 hypothetical protein [Clostridium cibarium]
MDKNRNKVIVGILLIIVLIPLLIGIKTKRSFQYTINQNLDFMDYQIINNTNKQKYYDQLDNIGDIFKDSPIVARVKMTNEREYLSQCVLSSVEVEDVLKGDIDLEREKKIYIYEPITVQVDAVYTSLGYIPMIEGNEYIVFLKQLKVPNGYNMSNKEKKSFMYYNPTYGKSDIDGLQPYISDGSEQISIRDVSKNNVIIKKDNLNEYSKYQSIISQYLH